MTLEEEIASLSREALVAMLISERTQHEAAKRNQTNLETKNQELAAAKLELEARQGELEARASKLAERVNWLERQIFGRKSEKRLEHDSRQLSLGDGFEPADEPPDASETVKSYQRRNQKKRFEGQVQSEGLRFGSSVPVETIPVKNAELEGLVEGRDYEVVGEKVTHRLAQRSAYVLLRFVRQVVKLKGDKKLKSAPTPPAVLEKSYADVSFLAWLLVDKFLYHLPLYRQHQRLMNAGVSLSRQTLTNLVQRAISLLEPVYYAQLSSILTSDVLLMDETWIKAGLQGKGKMHKGYFWPIYGDKDEVAFPYAASRRHEEVGKILGNYCNTLVTDGYEAYDRFTEKISGLIHALCWSHCRRHFLKAEKSKPELVKEALRRIRELYRFEEHISKKKLEGPKKLRYRTEHSRPVVTQFFAWLHEVMRRECLEPSNLFCKAATYAIERRAGLEVFLSDPNVPIDTNGLERTLRPIPMGRKNWLFCWTEVGAESLGKIQSLLQTCRLQGVDPYTWLVDVLQRIDSHPAIDVHLLTPRLWKDQFAANPLRSRIDR